MASQGSKGNIRKRWSCGSRAGSRDNGRPEMILTVYPIRNTSGNHGASISGIGAFSNIGTARSSDGGAVGGGLPGITNLQSLFKCSVCFGYVLPPILQCRDGHLICSNCRPKLTSCPTCTGPLTYIRNLAMEKVANRIRFPCKYSVYGCPETLLHTEKWHHEELCAQRTSPCPCSGATCRWQGSLDEVMLHFLKSHRSIAQVNCEEVVFLITDIHDPGALSWIMVLSCFKQNFVVVIEKRMNNAGCLQFFATVHFIGSRKQADIFNYKLALKGHRRLLMWEAAPKSIHENISALGSSDCLVFNASLANLFENNGNLSIHVAISKAQQR